MYFSILEGVPTKIYGAHQQNLRRGARNVIIGNNQLLL